MTTTALKKHDNYSESDYAYLKNKGYTHTEIKELWDRQSSPCHHAALPIDIVAYLNGIK